VTGTELLAFIERNPIGSFLFGCAILTMIERVVHSLTHINSPVVRNVVECNRKHVADEDSDD
jgi:hypothetical protein